MKPDVRELPYVVYSEFQNSNWYIYWDTSYAATRNYQLLVVWHINEDAEIYYDYMHLKPLVENKTMIKGITYRDKLPQDDIDWFDKVCIEFVMDVEKKYPE